MTLSEYISVKEAAALLGVSTRTINTYRLNGFIIARPLPSKTLPRYRYLRASVLALVPRGTG